MQYIQCKSCNKAVVEKYHICKIYKCKFCDYVSSKGKINNLQWHHSHYHRDKGKFLDLYSEYRKEKLQCKFCDRLFTTSGSLKTHHSCKHRDSGKFLDFYPEYRKEKEYKEGQFKCKMCDKTYQHLSTLVRHHRKKHAHEGSFITNYPEIDLKERIREVTCFKNYLSFCMFTGKGFDNPKDLIKYHDENLKDQYGDFKTAYGIAKNTNELSTCKSCGFSFQGGVLDMIIHLREHCRGEYKKAEESRYIPQKNEKEKRIDKIYDAIYGDEESIFMMELDDVF